MLVIRLSYDVISLSIFFGLYQTSAKENSLSLLEMSLYLTTLNALYEMIIGALVIIYFINGLTLRTGQYER